MNYTAKRKLMNSTVYIVIGLVALAVLLVSIATVAGMRGKKPAPTPTVDRPEVSLPSEDRPVGGDDGKPLPSGGQTSAQLSPSPSESQNDKPVIDPTDPPLLYLPAEGSVFKGYSIDLPVYSLTMNDYRAHTGVDISAELGSAVVALTDGKVCALWSDPMMGTCLSIDHGHGLLSHYKNLAPELPEGIAVGSEVKAGQTVGAVGDSCLVELAETEHLHFEVTLDGRHVDPMTYLQKQES